MSDAARVTAVDAINELRAALVVFNEAAAEAVVAAEAEIRRTEEFIEEQLKYWQQEVRRGEDAVFQARNELTRRKMINYDGRPIDTTEQEKELRRALARLDHAEEQVRITRHWSRQWPQAVIDYQGPAGQLQGLLEATLPRACAFLERKLASLDAYLSRNEGPKK
jgi:hypothetical protein